MSGWGRNFERTFTKFPPGSGESTGHHRVLRYPLGDLNCVVRFEVDAIHEKEPEERSGGSNSQIRGQQRLYLLGATDEPLCL